jgi:hypothetical protein
VGVRIFVVVRILGKSGTVNVTELLAAPGPVVISIPLVTHVETRECLISDSFEDH